MAIITLRGYSFGISFSYFFPSKWSLEHVTSRISWDEFRIKQNKPSPNPNLYPSIVFHYKFIFLS